MPQPAIAGLACCRRVLSVHHDSPTARIRREVLEGEKRPVSAVADNFEAPNVLEVYIAEDREVKVCMLFDAGRSLGERVLAEQFSV